MEEFDEMLEEVFNTSFVFNGDNLTVDEIKKKWEEEDDKSICSSIS